MRTIGIDLGTTNSLVSYWHEDGAKLIPNIHGTFLTPSVISIDQEQKLIIGQPAKERLVTHPNHTVSNFKRFMGTDKVYQLGKQKLTPVDLSALVLKSLKQDAEVYLNEPIENAIISVPAYFNEHQRQATIAAGKIAGLNVLKLITEPTAAAIAYGLHQKDQESTFAILDLGGGTFDISILEMFEGVMEVRSIAGDVFLGGEDFTVLIQNYFIEQLSLSRTQLTHNELGQLYKQAEIGKRALSDATIYEGQFIKNDQSYPLQISREGFEQLVQPLLNKLKSPMERALKDARLKPSDIDTMVLIGGATRMPFLKMHVTKLFGKLPFTHIHPDETVALGVAVQIALREKSNEINELVMTDVCPFTLGLESTIVDEYGSISGSVFSPIIERNTVIPCSRISKFTTIKNNQKHIELCIYQGESLDLKNNLKLGNFTVKVPPKKAGEETLEVRFTYDVNGLLEVEAKVESTGNLASYIVEKIPGVFTPEEIKAKFESLKGLKIHPREQQVNQMLLAKAERLYEEYLGEERLYIGLITAAFIQALETQNPDIISKAYEILTEQLRPFEEAFDWD